MSRIQAEYTGGDCFFGGGDAKSPTGGPPDSPV